MSNYSGPNKPRLVYSPYGAVESRGTFSMVAISSSAIYEGSFVSNMDAPATSLAQGVRAFADDDPILGMAVSFRRYEGSTPIKSADDGGAGTITNATSVLPMKYTFASTNDRASASPYLEMVEILPMMPGDIWEVSLLNDAGTATANRATTSNSDIVGYCFAINTTSPFGLTESGPSLTTDNLDFQTVTFNGRLPERADRVYVMPLRARTSLVSAN